MTAHLTAESLWNAVYGAAAVQAPALAAWMERKRTVVWPLFVEAAARLAVAEVKPSKAAGFGPTRVLGGVAKRVARLPNVSGIPDSSHISESWGVQIQDPETGQWIWDDSAGRRAWFPEETLGDIEKLFLHLTKKQQREEQIQADADLPDLSELRPAQVQEFKDVLARHPGVDPFELWESAKVYRAEGQQMTWLMAFKLAASDLDPEGVVQLRRAMPGDESYFRFQHSPETGTVLHLPQDRRVPSEDFDAIRSKLGMNWSSKQGFLYRARSQGKRKPTIGAAYALKVLSDLGYTGKVDYDPREHDAARALAAKRAYLEGKAERLHERAEKHAATRDALHEKADHKAEGFWGGQPILVGHHSERKMRRAQKQIWTDTHKAVEEHKITTDLERRAAAMDRAAARASIPTAAKKRSGPGPSQAKNEWVAELAELIARKLKKLTGATLVKRGYFGDTISFDVGFGAKVRTFEGVERLYQVFANRESLAIYRGKSMLRGKADWEVSLSGQSPEEALGLLADGFKTLEPDAAPVQPTKAQKTFTIPVEPGSAREGVLEIYGKLRVTEMPDEFDPADPDDADALLVARYLSGPNWANGKLTLPLDVEVIQAFMRWTDYATSVNEEEAERTKDPEVKKDSKRMAKAAETLSGVFLEAIRRAAKQNPRRSL